MFVREGEKEAPKQKESGVLGAAKDWLLLVDLDTGIKKE